MNNLFIIINNENEFNSIQKYWIDRGYLWGGYDKRYLKVNYSYLSKHISVNHEEKMLLHGGQSDINYYHQQTTYPNSTRYIGYISITAHDFLKQKMLRINKLNKIL